MLSEAELRAQIAKVLAGEESLEPFADWLATASWDMHKHASAEVQRMVGAIQLALADQRDDEVRALLRSFVDSAQKVETASVSSCVFVYRISEPAKVISQVAWNSYPLSLSSVPREGNRIDAVLENLILNADA